MQNKIIDLKQLQKNQQAKQELFKNKKFLDYIKTRTTINLFIDQLSILITELPPDKNGKPDFEKIGKIFTGLLFYQLNPNKADYEYFKNNIDGLDKDTYNNILDIIDIYNNTITNNYKKSINGQKGGRPTNNEPNEPNEP